MSTDRSRRPRPHPARRARRAAGTLSVAGMVALTGCMAVATKASTVASPAVAAQTASSTATTPSTSSSNSRSIVVAPVASAASTQFVTSTHAS